jgi:hypothetical protein
MLSGGIGARHSRLERVSTSSRLTQPPVGSQPWLSQMSRKATRRNLFARSPGRNLEDSQFAASFDRRPRGLEVA